MEKAVIRDQFAAAFRNIALSFCEPSADGHCIFCVIKGGVKELF